MTRLSPPSWLRRRGRAGLRGWSARMPHLRVRKRRWRFVVCSKVVSQREQLPPDCAEGYIRLIGYEDVISPPWHRMRYQHVVAIRTRLQELGLAPTAKKGCCSFYDAEAMAKLKASLK